MMIEIVWLVERKDLKILCSGPQKVDTAIRGILQDGDYKITDLGVYEHIRLSLTNIDSPKESYVQLGYNLVSVDDPESIKITRMQLL